LENKRSFDKLRMTAIRHPELVEGSLLLGVKP